MGEAKFAGQFYDGRNLIAEFPDCYFCGGLRRSASREHMPPKSLFDNAYRPDKLVMPACDACNRSTSTADLAAAIISRWNYTAHTQSFLDHGRLVARARTQAPDLLDEWRSLDTPGTDNARRHLIEHGVPVPSDAGIGVIGPLTTRQLNLFAHKAVLALYFEHFSDTAFSKRWCLCFLEEQRRLWIEGRPPIDTRNSATLRHARAGHVGCTRDLRIPL